MRSKIVVKNENFEDIIDILVLEIDKIGWPIGMGSFWSSIYMDPDSLIICGWRCLMKITSLLLLVKTKKDTDVLLNGPSLHGLTC